MSLYTMLESKGTLYRPTIGRDAAQGVTQDFDEVIAEDVICSVQPASASTKLEYAQNQMSVNTTIFFSQTTPVVVGTARPNDIFVATNTRTGVVHTFEVVGISPNLFARLWAPFALNCYQIS